MLGVAVGSGFVPGAAAESIVSRFFFAIFWMSERFDIRRLRVKRRVLPVEREGRAEDRRFVELR